MLIFIGCRTNLVWQLFSSQNDANIVPVPQILQVKERYGFNMNIQNLNKKWFMEWNNTLLETDGVPCSMYSTLIKHHILDDPYYRENEKTAMEYSRNDYVFVKKFEADKKMTEAVSPVICFEMLDTLADVYLNGTLIGHAKNMHRTWKFPVKDVLRQGENEIKVKIYSPVQYAEKMNQKRHLWGQDETTLPGYQYIRKAHYMFGWDWGPCLPDVGIYRSVYLYDENEIKVDNFIMKQKHDETGVELSIEPEITGDINKIAHTKVTLIDPDGEVTKVKETVENKAVFNIKNPKLWWPNGFGDANLYTVNISVYDDNEKLIEQYEKRIGLRTISISRENDEWGQEFCFMVNGVKIFAMGSDYIPEDNIIPYIKHENTRKLLSHCKLANFNCIRVWGGGYYPDDEFFDYCDEFGLIVWQDNLFACAVYLLDDEFRENIRIETEENVRRIRNHASIGLWCGNNEMETAWECWGIPQEEDLMEDYDEMFEHIIKDAVNENDGITQYWPSSPSSGDKNLEANDFNRGDVHYWDVWHNMKPMKDVLKHYFRFCSEYGFEAMPSKKTLDKILLPEDCNLYSPAMEAHHKCVDGNHKLMYYLGQCLRLPVSFEQLIYATQLMQAEAIRMNVEHMRRHRGRCMGSVYWQLNDSNPTISWSSIDYNQRWKALQYFCKRFYAPVLLSAVEEDGIVRFNISNETMSNFRGKVSWRLRDNYSNIVKEGICDVAVQSLTAQFVAAEDFSNYINDEFNRRKYYVEYMLEDNRGKVMDSVIQFVEFKHFEYLKPQIIAEYSEDVSNFTITFSSDVYVKDVCLDLKNYDCVFSDNWFDLHAERKVEITISKESISKKMDINELKKEMTIASIYDIGR